MEKRTCVVLLVVNCASHVLHGDLKSNTFGVLNGRDEISPSNIYPFLFCVNQIVRFQDKESHQIFLEPEGRTVPDLYVQVQTFPLKLLFYFILFFYFGLDAKCY